MCVSKDEGWKDESDGMAKINKNFQMMLEDLEVHKYDSKLIVKCKNTFNTLEMVKTYP